MFLQQVHVENFPQENRQKFRCQFFLDFLCFIAFPGVSRRCEFKGTTKSAFQKSRRIVFTKKIDQKNPNRFFLFFSLVFTAMVSRSFQLVCVALVCVATATHYEDPNTTGACASDEQKISITGALFSLKTFRILLMCPPSSSLPFSYSFAFTSYENPL
jgi:hypothetical protein